MWTHDSQRRFGQNQVSAKRRVNRPEHVDSESGVRRCETASCDREQAANSFREHRAGANTRHSERTGRTVADHARIGAAECIVEVVARRRLLSRARVGVREIRGGLIVPTPVLHTRANRERDTPFDRDGDVQADQVRACHLPLSPLGGPRRRSPRVARVSHVRRARRLRRRVRRRSAPRRGPILGILQPSPRPSRPYTARAL
jgi:hypothetical protein